MIAGKESLDIELKSDRDSLKDSVLIDAVVAMANTDGGRIYVGVEDDGTVTGVRPVHDDPRGVCALIRNRTVPSVGVTARIIEQGRRVLEITVPKCRFIVASSDGKVMKRRLMFDGSPKNVPMFPYEMSSRLAEVNKLDYTAQLLDDAAVDDFDRSARDFLRSVVGSRGGDTSLLQLADNEFDKALGFTRFFDGRDYVTVAGLLMIGRKERILELLPSAKASFQALRGSDVVVNEDLNGPLPMVFERFESYLGAWNPGKEISFGMQRILVGDFSMVAFREALVNAFCHRDYTKLGRVRVVVDSEGLSINSPGGFIEGVDASNLLTVEPVGRNPLLSDILKRVGLAERTGRGVDKIYEESLKYGRPLPDYSQSTREYVRLFIPRVGLDEDFTLALMEAGRKSRVGFSVQALLVLNALRSDGPMKLDELVKETGLGSSVVEVVLGNLQECSLVEQAGTKKKPAFSLVLKRPGLDVIKKDVDDGPSSDFVQKALDLAGSAGRVDRDDLMALGLSPGQAYRILRKMRDEGLLRLVGGGRSSYYVLNER